MAGGNNHPPLLGMIWAYGPVMAAVLAIIAMPVIVSLLSLLGGTFSWRNYALYLGDPALAIGIGLGGYSLSKLAATYWFQEVQAMAILLTVGYTLCVLTEYLGRFKSGLGWSSYRVSDMYHALTFGPMFYWVMVSLAAAYCAGFVEHTTSKWVFVGTVATVFFWAAMLPPTKVQMDIAAVAQAK